MEEKLIELLYENNLRLIDYFLKLPNTGQGTGHSDSQEEDIDIETAINEDVSVINSVDNNQGG